MATPSATPVNPSERPSEPTYESVPITSPRSLRQLSVFAVGAACFLASTALTRRAIYRRQLRIPPKFYEPNTNPHEHFSPLHDALQAINLATMNCVSVGIMAVGGTLWTFDISGLREAQSALRGRLGYESIYQSGQNESESEQESLEEAILRKRTEGGENNSPEGPR
ncbi:hypothetical protein K505DRAFT_324076 [Melanomma pulvis-pyrius CBS 109.77]|uniref:Altered inheritance of mitochondria protein 11 n=1 Tax=Melanomma pulvis-pyrius CBS 109.77 TaxID=1314802 RepID=A0A6A6XGK5_9PLEO|nr:hypothetical protein K505DRAFT_324076 [Melanomma pulvis-pyrius CBS 109.77]